MSDHFQHLPPFVQKSPAEEAEVTPLPDHDRISIILPVLNEAAGMRGCLGAIQNLRHAGHEVIVVDGGSRDETQELAAPLADQVIATRGGRGTQMNQGAAAASCDTLLFLHADTLLPLRADELIRVALSGGQHTWGRFDVRLSGQARMFRVIESLMNRRSRLTGIATGDQAIFIRRSAFAAVGGFPEIPLMEDIAISKRLKQLSRPACIRNRVVTSSRRWEEGGIWRTIIKMWRLRLAYFLGVEPDELARRYRT